MTHYKNLDFILRNGLHCSNCSVRDPTYIGIGHGTLIASRGSSMVNLHPFGVLGDYIPFYFHYKMPMLHNIHTRLVHGFAGSQEDIVYIVSSAETVAARNIPFVFTDRHAYLAHKRLYNSLGDLDKLDWNIIRDDAWMSGYTNAKKEVKQAEFLVHQHLPVDAILGFVVHNQTVETSVQSSIKACGLSHQVAIKPNFYF